MAESLAKRLQRFFNIGVKKTSSGMGDTKEVVPTFDKEKEDGSKQVRKLKLPSEVQKLWDYFLTETSDSSETLKNRMDRYDDLDYMIYNDTMISMAADLYADEASQADSQTEPIIIEAKKPAVRNAIRSLFEKWGIDQTYVRETAWNIVVYGDSFDINIVNGEQGIEEVIPQDVKNIVERIEFKATEVAKNMKGGFKSFIKRDFKLQSLVTELESSNSDYGHFFQSYLLGYQLAGDMYVAPWAVNHYRNFSRKSEFWPYGRSMFINSIGPFRQLKTSKNLMAMARALKFPKEQFEVQVSENMTESEQWDAVNEARQEYQNLGTLNQNKDEFSIGGEIWVPQGLINHTTIENNLRIEDIADIELLRDDLIVGTRVPKGYLIVDRGGFGTSSQSLLQQFKPFGRAVYSIQSVILEQLTKLVKMHFLMTGEFQKEMTEFQLSMNFPVIEEAADRLRMKSDTLRLAGDVVSGIQNALGTRDGLPPDVVEQIFSKLSFMDPDFVKEIMKKINNQSPDDSDDGSSMFDQVNSKMQESEVNKIKSRLNEDIIYDSYFESLNRFNIKEGVFNGRHFVNSFYSTNEQQQMFSLLRRRNNEVLQD